MASIIQDQVDVGRGDGALAVSEDQIHGLHNFLLDFYDLHVDSRSRKQIDGDTCPQAHTEAAGPSLTEVPMPRFDAAQLARLREIRQLNPDKLEVRVYETTNFSDEAKRAEKQYGIKAERREVDRWSQEEFFLGAAVKAGLDKVIIPFFEIGTSVEYELVRSICTVGHPRRKKLGVVGTDAHMMGRIDFQSMMSGGSPAAGSKY